MERATDNSGIDGLKARMTKAVEDAASAGLEKLSFNHRTTDNPEPVGQLLDAVLKEISSRNGAEIELPAVELVSGRTDRRRAQDPLSTHGCITREGDVVVVRKAGDSSLLELDGVTCENPDAPESERVYRKEFREKKIYLPEELDQARRENLGGNDTFIIGMTGFSKLGADTCQRLSITEEKYVQACADILGSSIKELQKEFPGIQIKLVDGASNMGVDKAAIAVSEHLNLDSLGFSCPNFMFYVKDDKRPVYVAKTQQDYSLAFIRSLDILYSVGGRLQALKFDMLATVDEGKRMVRLNVLQAIAPYGNIPARDASGKVLDATSALDDALLSPPDAYQGGDYFKYLRNTAAQLATTVARRQLDPSRAYGRWKRD